MRKYNYLIEIRGERKPLPYDLPVPQIGSMIWIDDTFAFVTAISYHVYKGKIETILIITNIK